MHSYTDEYPSSLVYSEAVGRSMHYRDTGTQVSNMRTAPGLVLRQEGLTNDVCAEVNRVRREQGFSVSAKVSLYLEAGAQLSWALVQQDNFDKLRKRCLVDVLYLNEGILNGTECVAGDKEYPFPFMVTLEGA